MIPRVVLNSQYSSRAKVKAGSVFGPQFFLIFITDLQDITLSAKNFNGDLKKINKWLFQCKMSFIPDPIEEAQEF